MSLPQHYDSIDPTKRFAELHHNVQLMVRLSEKALKEQAKKIALQKASISQLEEDRKVVTLQSNMEHETWRRHQNVLACLEDMTRLLQSQTRYAQAIAPLTASTKLLHSLVMLESDEFFKQLIHQHLVSLLVPYVSHDPFAVISLFYSFVRLLARSLIHSFARLSAHSYSRFDSSKDNFLNGTHSNRPVYLSIASSF